MPKGKKAKAKKGVKSPHIKKSKKPVCFYTIAFGSEHVDYAKKMRNSLQKFHPDIPHFFVGEQQVEPYLKTHKDNKYRLYALFGAQLAKEYELVIQIDNDSIVTGDLSHIIEDKSYDVGCVLNNNLIDPKLKVWDIDPSFYVNAGFVAIRGERPWAWWNKLNSGGWFSKYQFREQDMLNIMVHYGDLNCKIFDFSNSWHGLIHKGQWDKFVLKDGKVVLPKTPGVCEEDKIIKIIHWAGGNVPKMNVWPHFKEDVAKHLTTLMEDKK